MDIMRKHGLLVCILLCAACRDVLQPEYFRIRWEPQNSGSEASIRGISAVSDSVCWLSGSQGTVARTVDGGETWEAAAIPGYTDLDFRDIQAFDENTALVLSAGFPAKILITRDGGRTWKETYSNQNEGVFFNAMAFWDSEQGIAVGDPMQSRLLIIRTQDGGETWRELPEESRPFALAGEAGFAASGTCVAVQGKGLAWFGTGGGAARVGRTKNFGESWDLVKTPILCGAASQGIFSLAFKDAGRGIIVGGDYSAPDKTLGIAAVTGDGGFSWKEINIHQPGGFRSVVAYIPGTESGYLAVGKGGADVSWDDGQSWMPLLDCPGYYCLSLAKSGRGGWAAGSEGRVAKLIFTR